MQDINEKFLSIMEAEEARPSPAIGLSSIDLQNIVNEHSLEDLDLSKDDAYLLHLIAPDALDDDEPIDHEQTILHESGVLSVSQRLKRATNLKRLSKRFGLLRKIKSKRMASPDRLKMRARKAAIMALRKKFLGNRKYGELTPQQKIQVDQELERRYGHNLMTIVSKLAQKLMSLVRRKEMNRFDKVRRTTVAEAKCKDKDDLTNDNDDDKEDEDKGRYSKKHLHRRSEEWGERQYNRRRGKYSVDEARKGSAAEVADEGDSGIIFQLRKAKNMKGNFDIKWGNGTKSRLPIRDINAALLKLAQMVNRSGPGSFGKDKQIFVIRLGRSEEDFYKTLDLHEGADPITINPKNKKVFSKVNSPDPIKNYKMFPPSMNPIIGSEPGTPMREHNEVGSTEAAQKFATMTPGQTGDFSAHPLSAPVPWDNEPVTYEQFVKLLKKQ